LTISPPPLPATPVATPAPVPGIERVAPPPVPRRALVYPGIVLAVLVAGALARLGPDGPRIAHLVWLAGLVVLGLPLAWRTLRGMFRGHFATDVVATLAIVTAIVLGEPLAGLVVVLMQTGGEALERYAEGRASGAVRALEEDAPRLAHVLGGDAPRDVPAGDVATGARILVRPGEMVPCDAIVVEGRSHVDVSRLTGEPIPVSAAEGVELPSGALNLDGPLVARVLRPASESQYERIVALVRTAQASKAPIQRLADRYAVWFTPLTLLVCVVAWAVSGDAERVLAVLVVATPCPLIIAAPVAIVGGIDRAARRRIVVRNGGALERLAAVDAVVLDKTGTVTIGRPRVRRVLVVPGFDEDEVLRLAGAVEHGSGHLLARSLVEACVAAEIDLPEASGIVEVPGRGVMGTVEGRRVVVGARSLVREEAPDAERALLAIEPDDAGLRAWIAIDGTGAGLVEFADELRPGVESLAPSLRALGVRRVLLLSGDREDHTRAIAAAVGIEEWRGELHPEDKVRTVQALRAAGHTVLMVGDGTNDAPALSAASVGIALAAHGGGVTAEAADAVLLADDPSRILDAIRIGRRSMRVARQSIRVGLGLSGAAMLVAAAGYIPPLAGALIQEGIDVAVILNALRASRPGRGC
jgi:heavy metal translocating P-type ATPase